MKTYTLTFRTRIKTQFFVGQRLLPLLCQKIGHRCYSKLFIITDDKVGGIYIKNAVLVLEKILPAKIMVVPQGEEAKAWPVVQTCYQELINQDIDRSAAILAFGGGTVSDLAGFVAATFMRGIDWYIYPTTLLAQVDASIGGKTGINFAGVKNLIGAFYQPKAVFADIDTLKTLSKPEFASGMAEVIKYAVCLDPSLIDRLSPKQIAQKDNLAEIIYRCLKLKCRIVAKDEREKTGLRQILNFGHTLGHAIEATGGFGNYSHGEAISIGMAFAARLSQAVDLCTNEDVRIVCQLLEKFGLPTTFKLKHEPLLTKLKTDKKRKGENVRCVLLRGIGKAITNQPVAEEIIKKTLSSM